MNPLPDGVENLEQLVLERDATLTAMNLAFSEAQSRLDQLALLVNRSRQMQLAAEERARGATLAPVGSVQPKRTPAFAESGCTC